MMTLEDVQSFLTNPHVEVKGFRVHRKASEEYVDVIFHYPDANDTWHGSIPFHYWRAGIEIYEPEALALLIESLYSACESATRAEWVGVQRERWATEYSGREVTKPFFDALLDLHWNCVRCDLPVNSNSQSRIKDIKNAGYLLATHTNRFCSTCQRNTTQHLLVPSSVSDEFGYEIISMELRRRIIQVLGGRDIYENSVVPATARDRLLPDHKFPEVRWDADTRQENPDTMSDQDIRYKFQLLDNRRNLQKREVCRNCYQSGKRGIVYGISYYYEGDENWPSDVPKRGKAAEQGCVGCPWYDLQTWRDSLNAFLMRADD